MSFPKNFYWGEATAATNMKVAGTKVEEVQL
jgi:beta-glucosidase/6-phospho-beta-glucosidase/beta-galactosidase